MTIFEMQYDESLNELQKDVEWHLNFLKIPKDEQGLYTGSFTVSIDWKPEEEC